MNRKERRFNARRSRIDANKRFKQIDEQVKKEIVKDYCFRYFKLAVAVTLLAVKDEKKLSTEKAKAILERINSLLDEFNNGDQPRLSTMLNLVKDELNIDLNRL